MECYSINSHGSAFENDTSLITPSLSDVDGSIINRKRQTKGLPNSFSSNLLRDVSSSRLADTPKSPGRRSVKSIVAWIEKSPDSSSHSMPPASELLPTTPSTSSIRQAYPSAPTPRDNGATEVEEYSLTRLRYKEFFTEPKLARCLDQPALDYFSSSISLVGETWQTQMHISGMNQIESLSPQHNHDPVIKVPTDFMAKLNGLKDGDGDFSAVNGQVQCRDAQDVQTF